MSRVGISQVIAITFFFKPQMENKNIELELGRRVSKGRLMNENLKLDEALCKSFDFLIWSGKTGLFKSDPFFVEFCELYAQHFFFFSLFPQIPKPIMSVKRYFPLNL